ncbi:MAG: lectin-like protein [Candidatus Kariarchaeaceae archaeon]
MVVSLLIGNIFGLVLATNTNSIQDLRIINFNDKAQDETDDLVSLKNTLVRDNFNGHRYELIQEWRTWSDAKIDCESRGGYLVTITSQEENDFITNLIGSNNIWIGFTDEVTEGDWQWVTGEQVTYTNWGGGNPDDWDVGEDYAEMGSSEYWPGIHWNDCPTGMGNYYVCEFVEIEHTLSPLTIIYPNGGETLQDIVTIQWSPSIDTLDHSVRYDVLYSIDNGITWKTIDTWFYESNYEWDTTELNDGTSFLIKIIAKCTESLTVEDTSDDNFIVHYLSPPSISTPSQTLKDVITLEWSASVDSLNQNITYSVHYSSDAGNNWNLLASGLTLTSYDWNTTAVSDGRYYKIKVVATSLDGLSSENILYGLLTIDNIPTDNTFLIIGLAIIAIFPELYFFRRLKKFLNYLLIKEGVETP